VEKTGKAVVSNAQKMPPQMCKMTKNEKVSQKSQKVHNCVV
jgi:hypothetical protein